MKNGAVALLPEIFLLMTLAAEVFACVFRKKATPKTFYTLAKCGLCAAFVSSWILYDGAFSPFYENSPYTTMFKLMVYVAAGGCFYLSLRCFLSQDHSSFRFYFLGVAEILLLTAALSCNNLLFVLILLECGGILNGFMLKTESDREETILAARQYWAAAVLILAFGFWGAGEIYAVSGSFVFSDIKTALDKVPAPDFKMYMACAAILVTVLFKMGAAPFHFWMVKAAGSAALPVCCFFMLVPTLGYYAILIKLTGKVLLPVYGHFEGVILAYGVMSIILGVSGANGEQKLRKMFSFVNVFNMGIVLLALSSFSQKSIYCSFVYLLAYLLAMLGIYAVFCGLKNKGEYLENLKDISGVASVKPLLAAAMLIFLISMLGLPPMFGFLGMVALLSDLSAQREYWTMGVVLGGKLLMAYAYLRVIKIMYFDRKFSGFDRIDKGTYIFLMLIVFVMVVAALNPQSYLAFLRGFLE